mmetsp:Transcript_63536/g.151526  ORF Transcript_63536/g.151526 Transcript_63536/m.151526 type:complete len:233 (+) Transcript_63536:1529-2227(+)
MFLKKAIEPIECTLVWHAHWEQDLKLAILPSTNRIHFRIILSHALKHAALERKRRQWDRAPVHLHSCQLEGNLRVQRFAPQGFWHRLWRASADAILEEAQSIRIRAGSIQVQDNSQYAVLAKFVCTRLSRLVCSVEALGVETNTVCSLTEEQRRTLRREANPHQLSWLGRAASAPRLHGILQLHDAHLIHVSARLHAHICACSRQQVLEATIAQRHQHPATKRGHYIQGGLL